MKIVAIANQKGGVGKTTTAVNLGSALAELGHRILLIDLDPQANATSSLGLEGLDGSSLYEPLLGGASITEKILPTERDGFFIVPADLDLAGAEVEIARMPNHLTRLAETLKPLQTDDTFDFVLLDCPPSLGILMSNALAAAKAAANKPALNPVLAPTLAFLISAPKIGHPATAPNGRTQQPCNPPRIANPGPNLRPGDINVM